MAVVVILSGFDWMNIWLNWLVSFTILSLIKLTQKLWFQFKVISKLFRVAEWVGGWLAGKELIIRLSSVQLELELELGLELGNKLVRACCVRQRSS